MTLEAYNAIAASARQRIEAGWKCTDAERAILGLVNDLSYELGQSLAVVPCLSDFAAALGVHKSTVSRAVRSALKKGYLLIVKRRDETLYGICMDTPADAAPTGEQESRESARRRLVELNENRLQGQADSNGQQRLPGIFESEEISAPAQAFAAMLQQDLEDRAESPPPPRAAPEPSAMPAPLRQCHVTTTDMDARLSRLQDTMAIARETAADPPAFRRAAPSTATSHEQQWQEMSRGLSGDGASGTFYLPLFTYEGLTIIQSASRYIFVSACDDGSGEGRAALLVHQS